MSSRSYLKSNNVMLHDGDRSKITHLAKRHPLFKVAGQNNRCMAALVRAITGHAPIGAYRARFLHGFLFQQQDPELWIRCPCRAITQTRTHVLIYCPLFHRRFVWSRQTGIDADVAPNIDQLSQFIEDNSLAFSFEFYELWVQCHNDL